MSSYELGKLAYETYYNSCDGKSIKGEQLPTWEASSETIQAHWMDVGVHLYNRGFTDASRLLSES